MKKFYFKLSRQSFAVLLGLFCATPLLAQTGKTVTGTVKELQVPLVGVMVKEEGTDNSTFTDVNGQYSLILQQDNAKLIFEQLDFPIREEEVLNRSVINVRFTKEEEEGIQLKDVVVNAGYYAVKDKERTGSIARVTAKEIENQPVNNVLSAIQGRLAGVSIVQNSGNAGGGFDIQIRGRNSLRREGNEPLYIVDGVPFGSGNTTSVGLSSGILPYGESNPLNFLNPKEIESIEILKDADATAIYGSRGANGVVLITTKKGKSGKLNIAYNSDYTVGKVMNRLRLMNTSDYLAMRRTAFENDGIKTYPTNAYDINGSWDENSSTNWFNELVGHISSKSNNQLSINAASDQFQFLMSIGHFEATTVYPEPFRLKKTNALISLNYTSPNQRFSIGYKGNLSRSVNKLPSTDLFSSVISFAPNAPNLYNEQGELNWQNNTFVNPLAALRSYYTSNGDMMNHSILNSIQLIEGLSLVNNIGIYYSQSIENRVSPSTIYNPNYNYGSERSNVLRYDQKVMSYNIEPRLEYNKSINQHHFTNLVGLTFQHRQTNGLGISASNFLSNSLLNDLSSASVKTISAQPIIDYTYQSVYGRFGYNYQSKYFINLTGRRDGSSRFGQNFKYGNFGAIGAAWIFSKENFLNESSWLSFGKIRGSYGITGNDLIGDYQYLDTYITKARTYDQVTGLEPNSLYNPNFSWEKNKKLEFALDLSFFRDRIGFSLAWYRNVSGNQLVGIPLPGTTGFSSIQSNLPAKVENKGIEIELSAKPLQNAIQWKSSLNLSFPQNKLVSFPDLEGSTYANTYVIGQPITIKKLYEWTGIDPITGLHTFKDFNQDGKINTEDKQVIKNVGVKWFGGWSNQVQYKNVGLDVLFQFVKQNSINYIAQSFIPGSLTNQPIEFLDAYSPNNPSAKYQRYSTGSQTLASQAYNNFKQSDQSVSDGSYIRLKNISISYQFKIANTSSLKLFLNGQNLWTLTNYFGADPEFVLSGYLPPLKEYTLGLQLNF
ncbi:SusC/RagA family TonB-linked outer membrane protein [Empedobacter sp.]|uniref:SusC/RagA family TonB-linked outer membrane protein n=1 Tax=Empedobacter sp. TaxID=1927715 RepID=UPI0028AA96D2|nr:SusC/RagA family TonB-linked outer membrane protein [Empedobacter sp.]